LGTPREQLRQGSIVWIEVPDPRGKAKKRPVVVLTATEEILLDRAIVGVAVSTSIGHPVPDYCVLLPWDRRGHPATRFRQRCGAVCNWLVRFRPSDVTSVEGYLPGKTLLKVIQSVDRLTKPPA